MNIGITGSRGFIGAALSRYLAAENSGELRRLVRNPGTAQSSEERGEFVGDLSSPADCVRFCEGQDVIYHLAHTNTPVNSDFDLATDARQNLLPLLNLIQAIQRTG